MYRYSDTLYFFLILLYKTSSYIRYDKRCTRGHTLKPFSRLTEYRASGCTLFICMNPNVAKATTKQEITNCKIQITNKFQSMKSQIQNQCMI